LDTGIVEGAILIPQQALIRGKQAEAYVAVVDADGIMRHRSIKVSRAIGNQWLVDEGLSAGERIVVEGQFKAQPGSAVEIVSSDTSVNAQSLAKR
jgi:membrane fusion protein (multidrug efflux system)